MDITARMETSTNEIPNLLFPPCDRKAYRSASYANSYVAILTRKEQSTARDTEYYASTYVCMYLPICGRISRPID